jgi:hypothetical protein
LKQVEPALKKQVGRQENERPDELKPKRWVMIASMAVALLLFLTIYLLRLDRVAGLIVDDAWYVLLAKSLASGQGYTIINSPSPGILPFYPPGFPLLLSLVFRFAPEFPANVWLLKSVSIAAMLGVGVMSYRYFVRDRALPRLVAFGIAAATVFYPAQVFLATSTVMSECMFMLVQLLTIVVIERVAREGQSKRAWGYALAGAVLASYAFLTRSVAVGLIVAVFAYLLKERLIRAALIFAAAAALFVGSWMLYARAHAPTAEQRAEQGGNIVQSYATQFWQKTAGVVSSGTISADDLPERVWKNASEIVKYDMGAFGFYMLFRSLEPGEVRHVEEELRTFSLVLSLLVLVGFVAAARERVTLVEFVLPLSLMVTLLWGWEQFRLLLPSLPFFIFYLLMGVRAVHRLYQRLHEAANPRAQWIAVAVVVWCFVSFNLYANVKFILRKYDPVPAERSRWIRAFEENEEVLKWAQENLPKSEVVAVQNPALLYLYTGHKTVASDDPAGNWETWNRIGVRYMVRTSPYRLPDPDANESKYRTVYRHRGELNLRVLDLGPPSSRMPWGAGTSLPPTSLGISK